METGYFYSKSTGLWVAREPLKIDARVIKAAAECNIQLSWDEEGRINYISNRQGLSLLKQLGATMLTLIDYWLVLRDAKEEDDERMIGELQSDKYTEWLNTLVEEKEYLVINGTKIAVQMPFGHPGWFNHEDIDFKTGLPNKVELNREKHSAVWKYWSFCDYSYVAAAVRGWVTSVGKPSLDLGIPADAVYPVLILRECRKELLQPSVAPRILEQVERLISDYETLREKNAYDKIYAGCSSFLEVISEHGSKFQKSREMAIYKIREKLSEILGILRIVAKTREDAATIRQIDRTAKKFLDRETKLKDRDFTLFVQNSRERLKKAVSGYRPIIFVMGHKNPDTDTVVSALAESYRNHCIDGQDTAFVPVVQGDKVPDEAKRLLGDRLSRSILLSGDPLYQEVRNSGQARWIMVDHNRNNEVQRFAVSIIDHHVFSEIALKQNISKTLEMVGSTAALITQKLNGLGVDIPENLARILYGAALMDTENRSELKMTVKDRLIMDDLRTASGIESDSVFYRDLMHFLLSTDDAKVLFNRDYKEDWLFFGFAVAKVKGFFDGTERVLKKELLASLIKLARQNNSRKNLSLTVLKIVDYQEDNETIKHERIYLIFNKTAFPEFKKAIFDLISTIVGYTFENKASTRQTADFIEFWGTGKQLSRKKTAPLLEPVVAAFNEYFYSSCTRLFVKRDFLKNTGRVKEAAEACGIRISWDKEGRINNITYGEAVRLLAYLGYSAMSLDEYWSVLKDAQSAKDRQMVLHLQSAGFVEFLNTVIEDGKYLVNKPTILEAKSFFQYEGIEFELDYSYQGERRETNIPEGKPGLIHSKDVGLDTGLPQVVRSPNIYRNPALWRYWSPDAEKNVATRSYIFLLGTPALDLKVHLSESFACLGIRPCCRNVELPEVKIMEGKDGITLIIRKEGETARIHGGEFFTDGSD